MLPLLLASAFVVAPTAKVRIAPRDDAAVVVALDAGTAVQVLTQDASWSRVVVGPRVFVLDALDAPARAIAPKRYEPHWPTGYVERAALGQQPPAVPTVERGRGVRAVERASLVFGCRGDLARAVVAGGSLAALVGPRAIEHDVCIASVDVRPPCAGPPQQDAVGRLRARFADHGPALRIELGPGASALDVVARRLVPDGCGACAPLVRSDDERVVRLKVPVVTHGRTVLHVIVPRYLGSTYDLVDEEPDDGPQSYEIGAFDEDPRDDPGPGVHLFAAPATPCCPCDDGDAEPEPGSADALE